MLRRATLLSVCGLAIAAVAARANVGGFEYPYQDEDAVRNYPWVVTAEIVSVAGGATNSEPPLLVVKVIESLKGEAEPGRSYDTVWNPPFLWADVGTPEGIALREEWYDAPNPPPVPGSKWILTGEWRGGVFRTAAGARYPLTPEKLDWARQSL